MREKKRNRKKTYKIKKVRKREGKKEGKYDLSRKKKSITYREKREKITSAEKKSISNREKKRVKRKKV